MKKYFNLNISSVVVVLLLVLGSVVMTANVAADESSKCGKITNTSQTSSIYIEKSDITFNVPKQSEKYFKDTKNKMAAEYLSKSNYHFLADFSGHYEIDLILDEPEITEAVIGNALSVEPYDYSNDGQIVINNMEFAKSSYIMKYSASYVEYTEEYRFTRNGHNSAFRLIYYDSFEASKEEFRELSTEVFEEVINSVTEGDLFEGKKSSANQGGIASILTFSFSLWIFLIPLFYILICNMNVAVKYNEWNDDFLSLKQSKNLLGFFSVFIVLHHLVQHVGIVNAGFLGILENWGVNFVGAFFFFSGYGLIKSYISKKDYLKGFFKKRLPSVLVPFYVCILIFVITGLIKGELTFGLTMVYDLIGIILINDHMWYIVEIVIIYILFRLIFGIIKNEKLAFTLMGLSLAVMIAVSFFLGHGDHWFQGEWWYNSTILFFVGMIVSRFEKEIVSFVKKHYYAVAVSLGILFFVFYKLTMYMLEHHGYWTEGSGKSFGEVCLDRAYTLGVQAPMIIFFVLFILTIGLKIKCENKVLKFFGSISLELYLIHNLFIRLFGGVSGSGIFCTLVLICSIAAAYYIHKADVLLISLITGVKPKKEEKKKLTFQDIRLAVSNNIKENNYRMKIEFGNKKRFFRITIREIICILICIITLFPIVYLEVCGTRKGIIVNFTLIPSKFFLSNVSGADYALKEVGSGLYKQVFNSIIVALPSAVLATYFGALAAYGFQRYKFKGNGFLWKVLIFCMFVPTSAGVMGIYKTFSKLHLTNKFLPVILLSCSVPSAVYFIRMYLKGIDLNAIAEAARIDGAGELKIFNRIIVPLIRPVLALELIFNFVATWNNGFVQTLLLMDWRVKTISTIDIFSGGGLYADDCAVAVAHSLVPIVVYIVCSKSVISSITLGGVKE